MPNVNQRAGFIYEFTFTHTHTERMQFDETYGQLDIVVEMVGDARAERGVGGLSILVAIQGHPVTAVSVASVLAACTGGGCGTGEQERRGKLRDEVRYPARNQNIP